QNSVALTYEVGTAIEPVTLPAAGEGRGTPPYSYTLTPALPAGLTFDEATRTISGTPLVAAPATEYTYTVTDAANASIALPPFTIEVQASDAPTGGLMYEVGTAIEPMTLPDDSALQLGGGTPPYTLSVSGLPAGVSYDEATRTISGTPSEAGVATVTITVTDANGASAPLPPLTIEVMLPPLDAPDALVAEDYKGADGQGDQGGFLLLSWDLSDDHDTLDGYRIFREIPSMNNEMVPWAMVDAVPGVETGRAVVATLDNVSTRWAIAAERDGRTTHGAAKAAFVSAENPYELMAETMTASMEAAQAGDAPVFAALLPQALAFAQGAAPRLQSVEGVVQQSEVTVTEEAVRAIDDIPPLPVPWLSALDAPNDEGGRVALTWTPSPSDLILRGVAGAIGPAPFESVLGVHGYSIYCRAEGDDEFVLIGQVARGATSFVDESAFNGVRYTYQVRPFDLDNETAAIVERKAMAVRNIALDSEGRAIFGLFGADDRVGFDDFFILADLFGLTAEDDGFDPAFDLAPSEAIDFDDFFILADNFGRSTAAAGKIVPMLAGLNADARMYLDARTAMPIVGEDFVLDVRLADFAAIKGYGLQVQYEADKLEFVEVLTDQPLGGSALAAPQVLSEEGGVLALVAHGDVVSDGEVALSLVFRPTTEIENTVIEITDNQTYDSAFGFNRLALPAPVQVQTRPEVFSLANNYPNPFNPATTIKYALPQAADVQLSVYNVLGQPVRTLVAEHQNAGRYVVEWDATNDSGHSLSSGMYFYRLEAGGDFLETKKMLLLK
ncbi:MAG: T9SS type A sorting domain-containing protein, partial [Gemmatimonadetes bacterium]|nr:T9SS type A sorting domain-containing protein [Gemmatimonadota bacterium]